MTLTYGSDEAGLICGYLFDEAAAEPVRAVDSAGAAAWLESAAAPGADLPGAYLWLHFNLSHTQAERWLLRHAGLSDTFYEALHDGLHSTRIERADDALVAVINDLHFDFRFEPSDISTLWINVGPRLVVTARSKPLRSVDALRTAVRAGDAPRSEHRAPGAPLAHTGRRAGGDRARRDYAHRRHRGRAARRPARPQARALGELRRLLVRLQRLLAPSRPPSSACCKARRPGWSSTTRWPCAARARSSLWCCATCRRCRSASNSCRKRSRPTSTKTTTAASSCSRW